MISNLAHIIHYSHIYGTVPLIFKPSLDTYFFNNYKTISNISILLKLRKSCFKKNNLFID